ncbi:hypothetical protein IYC_02979 [Clostridium sporogenes PA 3679]|nr:hypothetical protein IYC_02979 [Clostridium sporogenes PA 3679]
MSTAWATKSPGVFLSLKYKYKDLGGGLCFLVHGEILIKVYGKKYRHNARICIK